MKRITLVHPILLLGFILLCIAIPPTLSASLKTAVPSGTETAVTTFNQLYRIDLYTTEAEIGPVRDDKTTLYWWDGDEWLLEYSAGPAFNGTIVTLTDKTGFFAVVGPTERTYLPAVVR